MSGASGGPRRAAEEKRRGSRSRCRLRGAGGRAGARRVRVRGWAASRWPSGLSVRLPRLRAAPAQGDNGSPQPARLQRRGRKNEQLPRCPPRLYREGSESHPRSTSPILPSPAQSAVAVTAWARSPARSLARPPRPASPLAPARSRRAPAAVALM